MTAMHFDEGKLRMDLVPTEWEEALAQVFQYGASKYADHNWSEGGSYASYYGSARRHLGEWRRGNLLDHESGLPHLVHAAWNLMALATWDELEIGDNDLLYLDEVNDNQMHSDNPTIRAMQEIIEIDDVEDEKQRAMDRLLEQPAVESDIIRKAQ